MPTIVSPEIASPPPAGTSSVAVVAGGDYDLTTPDGRFTARIVGAVARKESEDRSRRVRRKHLELAERGKPSGQLGWGVRDDAERELVREAARRVLAGQASPCSCPPCRPS